MKKGKIRLDKLSEQERIDRIISGLIDQLMWELENDTFDKKLFEAKYKLWKKLNMQSQR